jgi:hypothetical protein
LDINKIFGAFNSSSKDEGNWNYYQYQSPSSYNSLDENHPRYFIKIFTKMVLSYTGYSDKIIDFFASADPEIDAGNVKKAGESMLYNRAYSHISKIDLQDEYHIKIMFQEANSKLEEALNKSLLYFENEEEYEKCAILKKYLDFLNFSS